MTQFFTRRESLRLVMGAAFAAAVSGCAGPRRQTPEVGTVGDPLPGEPVTVADIGGSRPAEALERWRDRAEAPTASRAEPSIIGRSAWATGAPIVALASPMRGIERITIHHDGMSPFRTTGQGDATARIDAIRRAHRGRGWADIGYHFAIDPAGRIYQARPLSLQGAHVKHHNERNLGIVVLGNFMEQRPTGAALASVEAMVRAQMARYRLSPSSVHTHQELRPTACPGTHLQRQMDRFRSTLV